MVWQIDEAVEVSDYLPGDNRAPYHCAGYSCLMHHTKKLQSTVCLIELAIQCFNWQIVDVLMGSFKVQITDASKNVWRKRIEASDGKDNSNIWVNSFFPFVCFDISLFLHKITYQNNLSCEVP